MTARVICACTLLVFLAGMAHAVAPTDDADQLREKVIGIFDRVCREETQQAAQSMGESPAVDRLLNKTLSPDTFCGCATAKLRAAFETERIDARDRSTVRSVAERASGQCAIDGLRSNFQDLCKGIVSEHYGEQILHGPYAVPINNTCTCTKIRLGDLTPGVLDAFMQQSKEDIWTYRQTGDLPAAGTLSMVGFMGDCGLTELKHDLIKATH